MWAELSGKEIYGLRFGTVNGYSSNFRNDVMINEMIHSIVTKNTFYMYSKNTLTLRAILGINDLVKAISKIVECPSNNKGIYNLASFNASVQEIAARIQIFTGVPYEYVESPVKVVKNSKLETSSYDFAIDSSKFCNTFNFTFEDTIESIVDSISEGYDNIELNRGRFSDMYTDVTSWDCKERVDCRVCGGNLTSVLHLGNQPLANSFCTDKVELDTYPLQLNACNECTHLQLSHVVNPFILFNNYIYVSGTSNTLREYFVWFVKYTQELVTYNYENKYSVLEIACNDGSQLDIYKNLGWTTIGVDPAENLFAISKNKEHDIYCDYWNDECANSIYTKYNHLDLIIAENVFAHTDDIHSFLENCKLLMKPETVLIIQTSQADMVDLNQYDTIYHEHLSFFNPYSMKTVVNKHGLILKDVTKTPIHGTSYVFDIRLKSDIEYVEYVANPIYSLKLYRQYSQNCQYSAKIFYNKLITARNENRHIIGYGASAKGNTILNYVENLYKRNNNPVVSSYIEFIVDDNPMKWGRFTPGTNIPIKSPEYLIQYKKSCNNFSFVMLTWNFEKEIKEKIHKLGFMDVEYISTQSYI
jgi:2-polyprenyl-3-methyl-5-hydroxy-6-metoxy-1,4-benzoquinol methylase